MTIDELIEEGSKFEVKTTQGHFEEEDGISIYFEQTSYIENENVFLTWVEKTKRFIASQYPNDRAICDFEKCASELNSQSLPQMVAILKSLKAIPTPCLAKSDDNKGIVVSVTQTQTQQQSISFVLDSIKDTLTETQFKEIEDIAKDETDSKKARTKIFEKLKSFGSDVLSNIVANLITNPNIWSQFV